MSAVPLLLQKLINSNLVVGEMVSEFTRPAIMAGIMRALYYDIGVGTRNFITFGSF